jgi:hypothetical protein
MKKKTLTFILVKKRREGYFYLCTPHLANSDLFFLHFLLKCVVLCFCFPSSRHDYFWKRVQLIISTRVWFSIDIFQMFENSFSFNLNSKCLQILVLMYISTIEENLLKKKNPDRDILIKFWNLWMNHFQPFYSMSIFHT